MNSKNPPWRRPGLTAALLTAIVISACAGSAGISTMQRMPDDTYVPRKILVYGFEDMSRVYGEGRNLISPLNGKVFAVGAIRADAAAEMTRHMTRVLYDLLDQELIPPGQSRAAMGRVLSAQGEETLGERARLMRLGKALSADAVLIGRIYRFEERTGNRYSVTDPATVSFDIDLMRTADGRLLWSAHFTETQQPLSDNLLTLKQFVRRKGQWITADEMAFAALDHVLKKLGDYLDKSRIEN